LVAEKTGEKKCKESVFFFFFLILFDADQEARFSCIVELAWKFLFFFFFFFLGGGGGGGGVGGCCLTFLSFCFT
jgi:hypothetical protein